MVVATQRADVQKVAPKRSTTAVACRHKPIHTRHLRVGQEFGQHGVALEDIRLAWHSHGGAELASWDDTGLTEAIGSAIRSTSVLETQRAIALWRLAWEEALSGRFESTAGSTERLIHGEKRRKLRDEEPARETNVRGRVDRVWSVHKETSMEAFENHFGLGTELHMKTVPLRIETYGKFRNCTGHGYGGYKIGPPNIYQGLGLIRKVTVDLGEWRMKARARDVELLAAASWQLLSNRNWAQMYAYIEPPPGLRTPSRPVVEVQVPTLETCRAVANEFHATGNKSKSMLLDWAYRYLPEGSAVGEMAFITPKRQRNLARFEWGSMNNWSYAVYWQGVTPREVHDGVLLRYCKSCGKFEHKCECTK